MKVLLVGASLNSGNRGVNALTRGQINLLLNTLGPEIKIKILSYTVREITRNEILFDNKKLMIEEIPCPKKGMVGAFTKCLTFGGNSILDEIKSSDFIFDISEGDSFSDIYGAKRFIQHSLIKIIAIRKKKKLIIMPQTLGPYERSWVKMIAKKIINQADHVFVRDTLSESYAKKDLGINRGFHYSPDMAFYMEPSNDISIEQFVTDKNKLIVGINVSALLYNGGYSGDNMFNFKADYKKLVDDVIKTFANMENVKVILIPHVMTEAFEVEDDFRVCRTIAQKMKSDNNLDIVTLDKYYREDEIKAVIKGCDFFIGSRMHACIGAISSVVPTAPIAYSRKFIGIWDDIGLGYCVTNPKQDDERQILDQILSLFSRRNEIKDTLSYEIPNQKHKIEEIINIIGVGQK